MSRVGGKPIPIPKGVKVTLSGSRVAVEGPKGKLVTLLPDGIEVSQEDGLLKAAPKEKPDTSRPFWGLARSLVANAVHGVHEGFSKELDIVGIGYRAQVVGRKVEFALGYSHPIEFPIPDGIEIRVDKNTHIVVSGADKQLVGQTAANIRALRKPDPYKQKGIRYTGEHLKRKAGKTGVG
ncbi:MAG TPA: 50S ribosomal protein L6 [Vicinamibacteria bacterium]|nr:50S ribosomal protein L6 [Vicinamibacteria bacterium]